MERKLKSITLGNGDVLKEVGCGNYVCRYCGAKATACNYVANLCLQIKAPHIGLCGAYVSNDKYMGFVTECVTCQYLDSDGNCTNTQQDRLFSKVD